MAFGSSKLSTPNAKDSYYAGAFGSKTSGISAGKHGLTSRNNERNDIRIPRGSFNLGPTY